MERLSPDDYTQLLSLSYYEGMHLPSQAVQASGDTAMLYQSGFTGGMYLPSRAVQASGDTAMLHQSGFTGGMYLPSQAVQAFGDTAMLRQSDFTEGWMSLSEDQNAAAAVMQSHQLPVADGTNSVPVQPMAPPPNPRKRKAPTLRRDEWEPVKARVIELHISQNLPLPEVKERVEEEFKSSGFTAT
jgi:hypothetical protein